MYIAREATSGGRRSRAGARRHRTVDAACRSRVRRVIQQTRTELAHAPHVLYYGGRAEIWRAARLIAREAGRGRWTERSARRLAARLYRRRPIRNVIRNWGRAGASRTSAMADATRRSSYAGAWPDFGRVELYARARVTAASAASARVLGLTRVGIRNRRRVAFSRAGPSPSGDLLLRRAARADARGWPGGARGSCTASARRRRAPLAPAGM